MAEETQKDSMHASRASKGGQARMEKLSKEQRAALARAAATVRWKKKMPAQDAGQGFKPIVLSNKNTALPKAQWPGVLTVGDIEIPVYVLDNRRRIDSR